jgi:hypothetical protein
MAYLGKTVPLPITATGAKPTELQGFRGPAGTDRARMFRAVRRVWLRATPNRLGSAAVGAQRYEEVEPGAPSSRVSNLSSDPSDEPAAERWRDPGHF